MKTHMQASISIIAVSYTHLDEVFFFTDAKTLKLPDDELITELKEDNPEWFN